jgi:hypothetical protein
VNIYRARTSNGKDKINFFAIGPVVFAPHTQTYATGLKEYGAKLYKKPLQSSRLRISIDWKPSS